MREHQAAVTHNINCIGEDAMIEKTISKICPVCNMEFFKNPKSHVSFDSRITCSRVCADKHRTNRRLAESDKEKALKFLKNTVETKNGCLEWQGATRDGYGVAMSKKGTCIVHRFVYNALVEHVQDDLCVLHKCDNRKCINPDHMFIGTRQENMVDMIEKGRDRSMVKYGPDVQIQIIRLASEGVPYKEVGKITGVPENYIPWIAKKHGINRRKDRRDAKAQSQLPI